MSDSKLILDNPERIVIGNTIYAKVGEVSPTPNLIIEEVKEPEPEIVDDITEAPEVKTEVKPEKETEKVKPKRRTKVQIAADKKAEEEAKKESEKEPEKAEETEEKPTGALDFQGWKALKKGAIVIMEALTDDFPFPEGKHKLRVDIPWDEECIGFDLVDTVEGYEAAGFSLDVEDFIDVSLSPMPKGIEI